MQNKNYHRTLLVDATAGEVIKKINQVDRWWKADFQGMAEKSGDKFTVPFGAPSFVDFVVSEWIPNQKVVWEVTDCYIERFKDKKEWIHTQVVFELDLKDGKTEIDFTHVGIGPQCECYAACEAGWNGHLQTLTRFINEGVGLAMQER